MVGVATLEYEGRYALPVVCVWFPCRPALGGGVEEPFPIITCYPVYTCFLSSPIPRRQTPVTPPHVTPRAQRKQSCRRTELLAIYLNFPPKFELLANSSKTIKKLKLCRQGSNCMAIKMKFCLVANTYLSILLRSKRNLADNLAAKDGSNCWRQR